MDAKSTGVRPPDAAMFGRCRFITTTDLWHIWQGRLRTTGHQVIVKICRDDLEIDRERLVRLVERSDQLQRQLDSRMIVRPELVQADPDRVVIAYPFLSNESWRPLTPALFWSHIPDSLVAIALVVDYLHHYRLVHGDIKRGNFMCREADGRFDIRLIDNDFVRAEFDPTQALIVCTPTHIAPEILSNQRPAVESDIYSCGALLRDLLESDEATGDSDLLQRLEQLRDRCLKEEPTHRPRSLLTALHELGLLNQQSYQAVLRRLLLRIGAGTSRRMLRATGGRGRLVRRLLQEIRLFGAPDELLDNLSELLKTNSFRFGRLVIDATTDALFDRTPDYWRISLSDDKLLAVVRQLRHDPHWPMSGSENDEPVKLLTTAAAHTKKGEYLAAYLCLKQVILREEQLLQAARDNRIPIETLREIYTVISQVRRPNDFIPLFMRLYSGDSLSGELKLAAGYLLVRSLVLVNELQKCLVLADELTPLAQSLNDDDTRFALLRHQAFCLLSLGERDKARTILNQLIEETHHSGNDEQYGHALMELSRLATHSGDHETGLQRLAELERLSHSKQFSPATIISMHLGFAMHYYQVGRYKKLLQHCRDAMSLTEQHRLYFHRGPLSLYMALADMRLARYESSTQELLSSIADRTDLPGIVSIATYLKNLGTINLARGHFHDARRLLSQARPLIEGTQPAALLGFWHPMLELLVLRGEEAEVSKVYQHARTLCADYGIDTSVSEFDGLKLLDRLHNESESVRKTDTDVIESVLADGHRFLASRLLVLMLLAADDELQTALLQRIRSMTEDERLEPAVPIAILLDKLVTAADADPQRRIELLKDSYVIASRSGSLDVATALCRTLGKHYLERHSAKVARRYFEAAQRHARDMGNAALEQQYRKIADSVSVGPLAQTLVNSVRAMSEILASLEDRIGASEKLIRYAVDLTGAERGVLFRQSSDRLRPAAYVSCDHDELKDIADFSRSIVATSTGDLRTVAIDNALEDERTNQYKSVIAHNIRAVVCAPIVRDGSLIGALYLDHHNLPGLFTDDDIKTVETVANFLAVCEMTADRISALSASNESMKERLRTAGYDTEFVGENARIREMLSMLPRIAGTSAPVLICGETGTGKECLAEIVHTLSPRARKPLVRLNCAAIAPTLIESELFGVAAGTATGVSAKQGKFEAADGGTLFLDEIGDMPFDVQSKVLRVLESQEFQRVGSNRTIETDIRFVYATNRNLEQMVKDGKFRQDLYYRIQTFQIEIPPLRKRTDDIPLLLEHFLELIDTGLPLPRFSGAAIDALCLYDWPGNVRELKSFVERVSVLHPGAVIQPSHLMKHAIGTSGASADNSEPDQPSEREVIHRALIRNQWNQSKTAAELNLPLSTLRYRIQKHKLRRS